MRIWMAHTLYAAIMLCLVDFSSFAQPTNALDSWSFTDTTNWTSDFGYAPISFTNLASSPLGNYTALVVDSTNAAWLQFHVVETNAAINLAITQGTVLFWFAPDWGSTNAGGAGPGNWAPLVQVGENSTNGAGFWGLYADPQGANLYFSSQTNGGALLTCLSAPVAWTTNRWHFVALTYTATNSALYLDGALATNGSGVTVWPGPEVWTNGFCIGSDTKGVLQAHGMFSQLSTYAYPVDADTIASAFRVSGPYYYLNPANSGNYASAPSSPSFGPVFDVVTGAGILQAISTNTSCTSSTNVWLTNVVASLATNGTVSLTFAIAGGSSGAAYDVFASGALGTNAQWVWLGQGFQCVTYTLSSLPSISAYVILGTPLSDGGGVTEAYERLVLRTDADTIDGLPDGWIVLFGLNWQDPNLASEDPERDGLTNLQKFQYGVSPNVSLGFGIWVASPSGITGIP